MECNKIWKIRHLPFPNFPSILILLQHQGALPVKMGLSVQWGTGPTLPEGFYHHTYRLCRQCPLLVCCVTLLLLFTSRLFSLGGGGGVCMQVWGAGDFYLFV